MKTKLFYLFIAVFMFSLSGIAQVYPKIGLIGTGNKGWNLEDETLLLTSDGITYTLVAQPIKLGAVKFREGQCWGTTECAAVIPAVTNPYGWGPVKAGVGEVQSTGWPSGASPNPQDAWPDIQTQPGVYDITFNRIAGSWSFVPTPLPAVKLFGTATTPATGVLMTATSSTAYELKKVALLSGNAQFEINTTPDAAPTLQVLGGDTFPNGTADDPAKFIPVSPAQDYDVTVDFTTGAYTFKPSTFPSIALVGNAAGGWPGEAGNPGPIDKYQMTTTDGITYTLNNVPIVGAGTGAGANGCVFRGGNAWAIKYGDTPFPTGTNNGGADIKVPAGFTGTYNVTLNVATGAYNFTKITYSIVGTGVGGWPGEAGNPGPIDTHQLSTVDGINYTSTGLAVVGGGAKFRLNNAWAGGDWGGDTFPAGTKTGGNIPTIAGTYNLTVNVLTGAYDFGTNLGVNKFDASSFRAYPNPTRGGWNITSGNDDITSIQVYDVQGKAVYTKFGASKEVNVNASELSKGVYFAKVSTANGSSTLKLIKE